MTTSMTSRIAGLTVVGFMTLSLLTACNPSAQAQAAAEAYIRANVGILSPEPAVLGGTFYVTDIEWEDEDTAVVSYEDGHIALKGRTNIERNGGVVRVSTFVIVEDFGYGAMSSSMSSDRASSSSGATMSSGATASAGANVSARAGAKLGEFCGGIAGILCDTGLMCRYDGSYPDAGGVCVR